MHLEKENINGKMDESTFSVWNQPPGALVELTKWWERKGGTGSGSSKSLGKLMENELESGVHRKVERKESTGMKSSAT